MRLEKLLDILRSLAPESLAEPWDKPGLHVGAARASVRRALLCIDLTEPVARQAVAWRAGLIVAYHPPIFDPIQTLTDADWKARVLRQCVRHDIAVYTPHTALDAAPGGVNDWLAAGLGPGKIEPIHTAGPSAEKTSGGADAGESGRRESGGGPDSNLCKLVTFIPPAHADRLRDALARAGGGIIGRYTHCSFNVAGRGTFRGGPGSRPRVGRAGRLEEVLEVRMEMVIPADRLPDALAALRRAHPYEEPAIDIYNLHSPPPERFSEPSTRSTATPPSSVKSPTRSAENLARSAAAPPPPGPGRLVTLATPVSLATLVTRIKRRLGVRHVELAAPPGRAPRVRRIALCAGAGAAVLRHADSAEVYFTGEMRHHDVLSAVAAGRSVLLAGHTQTERPYLPIYRNRIIAASAAASGNGSDIEWRIARTDRHPGRLM